MDYNEIENDKVDSSLVNIEALQKEYEVTLQQYQESVKNYISALQSSNDSNSNSKYVSLKERTWWGSEALSEGTATTKEECETMCANSENCSGATFNPVKRYCWIRKGDSSVTPGESDDYALIPKQKAALNMMKTLNDKLLSLNKQIADEINYVNPQVEQQSEEMNTKYIQLNESYQQLLEQKLEMEKQLQEYSSVEEEYDNQSLYVNQQASYMKVWVIITAVIVLITMKSMYGDASPPMFFTVLLVGIIVLIIITSILG